VKKWNRIISFSASELGKLGVYGGRAQISHGSAMAPVLLLWAAVVTAYHQGPQPIVSG